MQLHVLGSAAGGGVPQWNCACSNCTAAREQRRPVRTQASMAASADGKTWVLFNASTDIRAQIERFAPLQPRTPRVTPIAAIFLTDANIDHAAGVLDFRQDATVRIFSTPAVRGALLENRLFAPFALRWAAIAGGVEVAGLRVSPIDVDGIMPSFVGGAPSAGAAVAYRVADLTSGASALYAPVFKSLRPELERAAAQADAAFFDGSFWSDDELPKLGLGTRTAREMGHAPVSGDGGSLEAIARCPCPRKLYTHVNNSNPMLDPASHEAQVVESAGVELAEDGQTIELPAGHHAHA